MYVPFSPLCYRPNAQLCLQKLVQASFLSEINLGIAAALAAYAWTFNDGHAYSIVMRTGKGHGASMQNSSSSNVNDSCLAVMHLW